MITQTRIGIGYDIHRLVTGRKLVLGGVEIPFERGALGHSDGDALSHAITDALLGAASLGDLGRYFPDNDPQFKNASSVDLLVQVVRHLAMRNCRVGNVDTTVVIEAPRLAPFIRPMRARLAKALAIPEERVSIKAKSNEGLGAVGKGEAVIAHAVCTVECPEPRAARASVSSDAGTAGFSVTGSLRPSAAAIVTAVFLLVAAVIAVMRTVGGLTWEKSFWAGILVLLVALGAFALNSALVLLRAFLSARKIQKP